MDLFGEIGRLLANVTGHGRDDAAPSSETEALMKSQEELRERFALLGSACYAQMESGTPVPDELVEQVRMSVSQVQNLMAIRPRKRCSACGSAQEADARYCSRCGRPMPEEVNLREEAASDDAYCPACGALLDADGLCAFCGRTPGKRVERPSSGRATLMELEEPEGDDTLNE